MALFSAWNWDLLACGRQGHATYCPTEADLADRLSNQTPWGTAWRCLRCGDYVLGDPNGTGPADEAPLLLRGRALRDAFVLRLLAVDKYVRGFFVTLAAVAVWRFNGERGALQKALDLYLPLLRPLTDQLGIDLSTMAFMHWIDTALTARPGTIRAIAAGVLFYGLLQLLEATGLWLMKRWGEYVAVIGTSLFLPLEIYEVTEKVTVLRVAALVVNLFLVAYLVFTKRLFGARGGAKAYEATLHSQSLIEVERAAASQAIRHGSRGSRRAQVGADTKADSGVPPDSETP